jgi:hypothetical protein
MIEGSISHLREAANSRVLRGWGSPPSCQVKLNGDTIRPTASLHRASRLPQHVYVRLRGAGVSRNCEVVPAKISYEHYFSPICHKLCGWLFKQQRACRNSNTATTACSAVRECSSQRSSQDRLATHAHPATHALAQFFAHPTWSCLRHGACCRTLSMTTAEGLRLSLLWMPPITMLCVSQP